MNFRLLLTGNIAPKNVPHLKRTDITERENDYFEALKKWLEYKIPIVFCENSNFQSDKIQRLFANKSDCEYLKFETQKSFLGKGHGEAEIMEYAFEHSRFLRDTEYIIKVTGRYIVPNFINIIQKLDNKQVIYLNLYKNSSIADVRFFIFTPSFFYGYMLPSFKKINEKNQIYMEHVIAMASQSLLGDHNSGWKMINPLPKINGYSGTGNTKHQNNIIFYFLDHLKHKLKIYLVEL